MCIHTESAGEALPGDVSSRRDDGALRHGGDSTHSLPISAEIIHLTDTRTHYSATQNHKHHSMRFIIRAHTCRTPFSERVYKMCRELSTAIWTTGSATNDEIQMRNMTRKHNVHLLNDVPTVLREGELQQ